jgi:hypothetical protein
MSEPGKKKARKKEKKRKRREIERALEANSRHAREKKGEGKR